MGGHSDIFLNMIFWTCQYRRKGNALRLFNGSGYASDYMDHKRYPLWSLNGCLRLGDGSGLLHTWTRGARWRTWFRTRAARGLFLAIRATVMYSKRAFPWHGMVAVDQKQLILRTKVWRGRGFVNTWRTCLTLGSSIIRIHWPEGWDITQLQISSSNSRMWKKRRTHTFITVTELLRNTHYLRPIAIRKPFYFNNVLF